MAISSSSWGAKKTRAGATDEAEKGGSISLFLPAVPPLLFPLQPRSVFTIERIPMLSLSHYLL